MLDRIFELLMGLIGIFCIIGLVVWYIERDTKKANETFERRYKQALAEDEDKEK